MKDMRAMILVLSAGFFCGALLPAAWAVPDARARALELIGAMKGASRRGRVRLAETFVQSRDLEAVEALLQELRALPSEEAGDIEAAFKRMKGRGALQALVWMAGSGNPDAALAACDILVKNRNRSVLEPLTKHLKGENLRMRDIAAQYIGALGDLAGFEPVLEAIKSGDWRKEPAPKALVQLDPDRAREALVSVLRSDADPKARSQAAEAIAFIPDPAFVPPLIEALGDEELLVRGAAMRTLSGMKAGEAAGALLARIKAAGEDETLQILRALAGLDAQCRPEAFETMAALAKDSRGDPEGRRYVLAGLAGCPGREVLASLLGVLWDPDPRVRLTAVQALERRGEVGAVSALASLWKREKDPKVRAAAAGAVDALTILGARSGSIEKKSP